MHQVHVGGLGEVYRVGLKNLAPPSPPKVPSYSGENKRRRLIGPNRDVAEKYFGDPVQEDKEEPTTDNKVNQYSEAPGRKDTEMPITEYKYYDVQL